MKKRIIYMLAIICSCTVTASPNRNKCTSEGLCSQCGKMTTKPVNEAEETPEALTSYLPGLNILFIN